MAFYADEDEIYKCTTHPSKRRRTGICPLCLKQRLSLLCPDCATTRPCACYTTTTTSSSSSASSSFSLQFSDITRISNLIDGEPAFRRSKSTATFPFFRSARFSSVDNGDGIGDDGRKSKSSFWSVFLWSKKVRREKGDEPVMRRSRSVACATVSGGFGGGGGGDVKSSKSKGWYFPSPMKVFRKTYSKTPKFVHERSPLHRG